MRTTYVLVNGGLVLKSEIKIAPTLMVIPDLPDYESPIDGRVVHGRSGRREDFKRSQTRPYEGREQEAKEAARHAAYAEQHNDRSIDVSVRRALAELHPDTRRALLHGH